MIINVDISPKALRETLCIAQTRIGNSGLDKHRQASDIAHLQALIGECDRHRPLGPDGEHGDRHTPTCGCEDTPARWFIRNCQSPNAQPCATRDDAYTAARARAAATAGPVHIYRQGGAHRDDMVRVAVVASDGELIVLDSAPSLSVEGGGPDA